MRKPQRNYTVTLSASPVGAGVLTGAGTFQAGSSRAVTATPNTSYAFSQWTEAGVLVSTATRYVFTLTNNRTLVGNFAINPAAPGGSTMATNVTVTMNSCLVEQYPMYQPITDMMIDVNKSSAVIITLTAKSSSGIATHQTVITLLSSI